MEDFPRYKRHGQCNTKLYRTFFLLKDRCTNPNNNRYKHYGGKGIRCLWGSFSEFSKDMGESFDQHVKEYGELNTSIDRIDSSKNYCKENCRWATYELQNKNRKLGRTYITIDGDTKYLTEWARFYGINPSTVYKRIAIKGIDPKIAFTTKTSKRTKK